MNETRKPRSQAQRDAQINAMEAARGAAARRAEARQREAEKDAANQSRVEITPPRNPDGFMVVTQVRVFGPDNELRSSREFYAADEAREFAEAQFTRRGVLIFNWNTNEYEESN